MRCCRCGLPIVAISRSSAPSTRYANSARTACIRLPACCHTTDCGPSITSAATSSPRCAGRQWRNTACSAAAFMSAASTVQPAKARRRVSDSSSWPIEVQTSVYTASTSRTPSYGSDDELDRYRRGCGRARRRRHRARSREAIATTNSIPDERGSEGERRGHVVAVADVREAPALEPTEELGEREEVGERLARMGAVREQVHDRDLDRGGHAFEHAVVVHPRRDEVAHARERAGDVLGRFPLVDPDLLGADRGSGGRRASTTAISTDTRVRADGFWKSATTPRSASTGTHRVRRRPSRRGLGQHRRQLRPGRGRRPRGNAGSRRCLREAPPRASRRRRRSRRR